MKSNASRLARCASFLCLCTVLPAWAGTTLTIANTQQDTNSVPVLLQFPVTRTGNTGYDAVMTWHTADNGSAVAGLDYTAASGTFAFPAGGATSTNVPVTIDPLPGDADLTFELVVDSVSTYGSAVNFATFKQSDAGDTPFSVAIADLNGDGKPDLVVTNFGATGNTVSVYINATVPGSPPVFTGQQTLATGARPISVTVADINGDGKPDLVTANYAASGGTISVLLNQTTAGNGAVTFVAKQDFACGAFPTALTAADFNGDGLVDIAVSNGGNSATVLLNSTARESTTAGFDSPTPFSLGSDPIAIASGDLNGDGKPDLAIANATAAEVTILFNTTTPGASPPTFAPEQVVPVSASLQGVAIADLNGDGRPDVVATLATNPFAAVLLNATAPGDTVAAFSTDYFATGTNPIGVAAADINGDGKPDLIVANRDGVANTISVLRNTTAPGAAVPTFAAQQTFAAGSLPVEVAAGDVNGDGLVDILVADSGESRIAVLRNTSTLATTAPGFASQHPFGAGGVPAFAIAADINGDGKRDLVVANSTSGVGKISVLTNATTSGSATPAFLAAQPFATAAIPFSVAAADINGDGRLDLVTANAATNNASVLLNTTTPGANTPTFATKVDFPVSANSGPYSVAAADLNGDGKPDLIATDSNNGQVAVRINTTAPGAATPAFAAEQTFSTGGPGTAAFDVIAADVNGDGVPDLIVANYANDMAVVLINTTTPGSTTPAFVAAQPFASGGAPTSVAAADINADGKPDLILVNEYNGTTVSVLLNATTPGSTTAAFAAPQTFSSGDNPFAVAAIDVDGDGRPDVVVANLGSNNVAFLRNTTPPGSGTVTFAAAATTDTGIAPGSIAATDLNGDGKPDLVVANSDFVAGSVSVLLNAQYLPTVVSSPAIGTIVHDYLFADGFE